MVEGRSLREVTPFLVSTVAHRDACATQCFVYLLLLFNNNSNDINNNSNRYPASPWPKSEGKKFVKSHVSYSNPHDMPNSGLIKISEHCTSVDDTGVGKRLHMLPSHSTFGKPQSFSCGTLTNSNILI